MPIPLQEGLVYGPLPSRRLGRSLGVNLLPGNRKVCSFNCPYCQYGWSPDPATLRRLDWPSPSAVADAVADALAGDAGIQHITLAGNGEPTLHPGFAEVIEHLRVVRGRLAPGARIAVLSNSSTLGDRAVVSGLRRADDRYMKLDGGDDITLRRLNGVRLDARSIIEGLRRLDEVVIQSMFVKSDARIDNTTPAALDAWFEAILRIRPSAVHVYSLDRSPASRRLVAVPRQELEQIAARVTHAGIPARMF